MCRLTAAELGDEVFVGMFAASLLPMPDGAPECAPHSAARTGRIHGELVMRICPRAEQSMPGLRGNTILAASAPDLPCDLSDETKLGLLRTIADIVARPHRREATLSR